VAPEGVATPVAGDMLGCGSYGSAMQYAPAGVMTLPAVPTAPSIGLDLYPANVMSSDGLTLSKVRVVGLNGQAGDPDMVLIYRGGAAQPILVSANAVTGHRRDMVGSHSIDLDDGTTITVSKASGCGCGSSLKYYRAFPMGTYGASW